MTVNARLPVAGVVPSASALGRLQPVGYTDVTVADGFWAERLATNRERTIPHGFEQLERAGNLHNLRLAAGDGSGRYRALGTMFDLPFPFLDSDVFKWLESAGWELGRGTAPELARSADEAIKLVTRAQRDDGYINSFVQVLGGGRAFTDLAWGHELYCIGHLIQAAVAWQRALGDDRLLLVAGRAADMVERELGSSGRVGIDGHPEIEMALVELYRTTGADRYLELAARMIDARGTGLLGAGRFGAAYWQDHLPARHAAEVAGHAVRQLYLDSGVVDVAVERGDGELLDAVAARWRDMVATRTYLTGGLGSRHKDEAFGDPFELPPDRAYAETCAGIASVMLAWRLLLATGDPACADVIERTMYNAVLPGLSLDGTAFFYVNALQRRTRRAAEQAHEASDGLRKPWFPCACCPPNLMRFLSSWPQYVATTDAHGLQVHQYATGEIAAEVGGAMVRLAIETGYPWDGSVTVRIVETPATPWTLSLRIPAWADSARVAPDDRPATPGVLEAARSWEAGDSITLDLGMAARVTEPDTRIDAVRGCVALERGPLVYCLEDADLPAGVALEDVVVERRVEPRSGPRPDIAASIVGLSVAALAKTHPTDRDGWPYVDAPASTGTGESVVIEARAIPYFAWANRNADAMRVWIPVADRPDGAPER
jgi:uncharacterized protein